MSVGVAMNVSQLAKLPLLEELSVRVFRVLGCNASPVTLQGTNTYIVGTGQERILIDTGNPGVPEYINLLGSALEKLNCSIRHIIVTHWHPDHIGGVTGVVQRLHQGKTVTVWKHPTMTGQELDCGNYEHLLDQQAITVEGSTLRAVHTPGHTDDHLSLLLEEENALFSGDCVLGESSTTFESLAPYLKSLKKLLLLKPSVMYPGHGQVIKEPIKWLEMYLEHRKKRELELISVLKEQSKPLDVEQLVRVVYKDTPAEFLKKATDNLQHNLEKLLDDGVVEHVGKLWKLC